MSKKRRIKGASAAPTSLPTGPVLVGKLVAALGLPAEAVGGRLQGKTAHRFFSGDRIEDEKIEDIFTALGTALVELGFAPATGWRPNRPLAPAQRAGLALHHMATRWDATLSALRGGVLRGVAPKLVALAAARLLVVDVALRAAAWLALNGVVLDESATPASPPEIAAILADLVRRSKLSHDLIAQECLVARTTVDDWVVRGARILDANLRCLVLLITEGREDAALLARARRELAIANVLEQLRDYFGADYADEVSDLWRDLVVLTVRFSCLLAQSGSHREDRLDSTGAVFADGAASAPAQFAMKDALQQERRPEWVAVLEVGPAWSDYLIRAARVARSEGSAIKVGFSEEVERAASLSLLGRPRHHMPRLPPGWQAFRVVDDNEMKASNRIAQYYDAVERGSYDEAATHARRAVELTPHAWLPHFLLGAGLGRIGKVDDGIAECEIAAQLATSDRDIDLAKVEIGIILTNAARHEEACAYLEGLFSAATEASAHLLYNLGVVRMRCEIFDKALEAFKLVLAKEEHHPRALDLAAHCAFVLGNKRLGITYAKRANLLGEAESYDAWRAGMYESRSTSS